MEKALKEKKRKQLLDHLAFSGKASWMHVILKFLAAHVDESRVGLLDGGRGTARFPVADSSEGNAWHRCLEAPLPRLDLRVARRAGRPRGSLVREAALPVQVGARAGSSFAVGPPT